MLTPEQMMAAQKANMDTLLSLTHKAFEGVERLVELNMQIARAAMTDSADTAKAALSVKDAQELLALQTSLLQPTAEKAAAYQRSLYELAQRTNAEWIQVAEAQMAKAQKDLNTMIDTATKGAPAGTESAVALVRSAVSAANNAFESVHKAARQAAEMADANLQAMAGTAMAASRAAASKAAAAKGNRKSA
ncbi:MAG: TIGR01841 family phasin [Burkholderiaceae bacterium]|jgi:phasin family protein